VGAGHEPTAVSALAAEVEGDQQGRGLSCVIIQAMAAAGRRAGLGPLIAPARPSWKDRYPLIPIAAYAAWRRADGLPFDPWMRVHARLGATVLRAESSRCTSPRRSPTGKNERACCCPRPAGTSSLAAWHR